MNKKSITQLLVRSVTFLALIHTIDIHTSCALIHAPGSPYTVPGATGVAYSPDGRYFVVESGGSGGLQIFSANSTTGELVLSSTATFSSGGGTVAYSPNGQFGVATGFDQIQTYTINSATGVWTPGAVTTSIGGNEPYKVAYSPDGRFVAIGAYNNITGDSTLGMYSVNQDTGALTGIVAYDLASSSLGLAVPVAYSSNGAFVTALTLGNNGNLVNIFSVDSSTGLLTAVPGSPFTTGTDELTAVAYSPDSRFIALTASENDENSGAVYVFAVSETGSLLDEAPGSPYLTEDDEASAVAYSINGEYAVVGSGLRLYIYSVNNATGAFTPLASSPFNATIAAKQIVFAPNSAFFAVLDGSFTNEISVLAIPTEVALSAAAIDTFGRVTAMGYGALPGATITLFANCTTVIGTGTADSLGNFTIVASTLLPTNLYEITATQTVDDCTSAFSNQILVGATMVSAFIQRVIDKYNSGC